MSLNLLLEDVDFITFGREFQRMLELADAKGLILRSIRNEDDTETPVYIMWECVGERAAYYERSEDHPTLQTAIRAEIKRMEQKDAL